MAIYCFSCLFKRHTIIFTSDYCWSAMENTITKTDQEVSEESGLSWYM